MEKKAVFFSIDALIAVVLLFIVILIAFPLTSRVQLQSEVPRDLLTALSSLKVSESNNSYVAALIADGTITDSNHSLLEQIGELVVTNVTKARQLAAALLDNAATADNIGIWYDTTLIYARNTTPYETAKTVDVARQIVSGIKEGQNITGFAARATLSSRQRQKYIYLGGYVGDGNLTFIADYDGNISAAEMELVVSSNFTLFINNNAAGNYNASSDEFTPVRYTLPLSSFRSGNNTLELRGSALHAAGGFIKLSYTPNVTLQSTTRQYFPGVEGIINVYDGLTIPGKLDTLSIRLHISSPQNLFLTLGNVTLWNGSGNDTLVTLTNTELLAKLNYTALSNTTTPIRLALEEVLNAQQAGNADIILITDLSASMNDRLDTDGVAGIARNCSDAALYNGSTKRISLAQCLDKLFIELVLNVSGNRMGIVGFYGDAGSPNKGKTNRTDYLTSNKTELLNRINNYTSFAPKGLTCICCAINSAYKILDEHSNEGPGSNRRKFIITMSDGVPTHGCGASNDYEGLRTGFPSNDEALPISSQCSTAGTEQCTTNNCIGGLRNANFSSCRARNELGATVHAIGFGPVKECVMANNTLAAIARCGQGAYYASTNASELERIYKDIAENIKSVSYTEQIANATNLATRLYADSFIEFNASLATAPYGLVSTLERPFTNTTTAFFTLPENATLLDLRVISYSGARWTSLVSANNNTLYNLSTYGSSYNTLGDPFVLTLPSSLAQPSLSLTLLTASSPTNFSAGSQSNKLIATLLKNASSFSPLSALAAGCIWNISFEDNSALLTRIPSSYTGSERCEYSSFNGQLFTTNDAFQSAVAYLLRKLDFDSNNKVDVALTAQDLDIALSQVAGIPYTWSTEVQIRRWSS